MAHKPAQFFPAAVGTAVTVAVEIKLSHAAIVALGHRVEPMVVPEPVKMGFLSPGRISFTSG